MVLCPLAALDILFDSAGAKAALPFFRYMAGFSSGNMAITAINRHNLR